jgi:hypothetical protein
MATPARSFRVGGANAANCAGRQADQTRPYVGAADVNAEHAAFTANGALFLGWAFHGFQLRV